MSAGSASPYSLYSEEYVTFGEDDVYDQTDAEGFINLFGLPLKMRALMKQHAEKAGNKERLVLMKLWGGRFTKATDKSVEEFNASIQFDCRMMRKIFAAASPMRRCWNGRALFCADKDAIVAGLKASTSKLNKVNLNFPSSWKTFI